MKKTILLVLPFFPWDENGNGINKIVYNLIKYSLCSNYRLLVVGNEDQSHQISQELKCNIESIDFIQDVINELNFQKLFSLFKSGTYQEQLNSYVKKEIESWLLKEVEVGGVNYIHYVTSRFINVNSIAMPKSKQLVSLIDNKELYYKRKTENSTGVVKLYSMYQMNKTKRIYENADIERKYHFVSKVDSELFRSRSSAPVYTIENGVDISYGEQVFSNNRKVFFHGNFSYEPNILAYESFLRIADNVRLKDIDFVLFGKGSDTLKISERDNVEVLGEVDDVSETLEYGSLYLSPITIGSGIKNKVLEAMSVGMTVIGTDVSFDGIELDDSSYRRISISDLDGTVDCILNTISDIEYRKKSSMVAKKYIEDNFSWCRKVALYERVYDDK